MLMSDETEGTLTTPVQPHTQVTRFLIEGHVQTRLLNGEVDTEILNHPDSLLLADTGSVLTIPVSIHA